MPDDIAKIGLDTADISRALDRISTQLDKKLGASAQRADGHVKSLAASLTRMGKVALTYLGFQSAVNGARAILNLNQEIESTRSKLVRGTKASDDFEASIAALGKGGVDEIANVGRGLDNLGLKLKTIAAKSLLGLGGIFGLVPDAAFKSEGGSTGRDEIVKMEDEAAQIAFERSMTEQERLDAIKAELLLQTKLIEYYSLGAGMDREKMNAAKVRKGDLSVELQIAQETLDAQERAAAAATKNIEATRAGFAHVGAAEKIIADAEEKIAQARREGRVELEKQLRTTRDLSVELAKAARARETPETRKEARKEARLLSRDARRDEARQAEFQRRDERGIVGGKGSPLREFQMGINQPAPQGVVMVGGEALEYLKATAKNTTGNLSISTKKN